MVKPAPQRSTEVAPVQSASERAYATLMREILNGDLAPEERLTEGEVAKRLELGKTPIREALKRLVHEGLVTLQPRNGYKIASVTIQSVEELCGLRLVTEPAAVALAAGQLSLSELAELTKLAKVTYVVKDARSVVEYLHVNRVFHGLIVSACGNDRLAALVDQLHLESARVFRMQLINYPDATAHRDIHEELVRALRAGDATKARRISEREISASRRFIIDSLIRSPTVRSVALGAGDARSRGGRDKSRL
jgi:DNA-binding GntR family transcriptional regulator